MPVLINEVTKIDLIIRLVFALWVWIPIVSISFILNVRNTILNTEIRKVTEFASKYPQKTSFEYYEHRSGESSAKILQ